MKKSSQRKESKYLSIVVIPHNTDEIKVFKISSVKYKLMALGAILLTMFICSGILITYLIYENRVLNEDRKKVIAVNNQQMNLITEREEIIQSYIRKVEEQDKHWSTLLKKSIQSPFTLPSKGVSNFNHTN